MRKHIKVRVLPLLGLLAATLTLGWSETRFIPPANEHPLFRRDLLPLETDAIRGLSAHLTTLVRPGADGTTAASSRADAQLLALALQLDPVNQQARRLIGSLERGDPVAPATPAETARALQEVGEVLTWLLSPAAGSEGRLLAQLVIDPLRVLHPDLPACRLAGPEGEAKRWHGTVPPVTAFIRKQPPPQPAPEESPPGEATRAPTLPEPEPAPVGPRFFALPNATIRTPLARSVDAAGARERYSLCRTSFSLLSKPRRNELLLVSAKGREDFSPLLDQLQEVLAARWESLPVGQTCQLSPGSGQAHWKQNQQCLTGPFALLLHASLSDTPLHPDLTMVGSVLPGGRLELTATGWQGLKSSLPLAGPQGRLLVPTSATSQLQDLLVMEKDQIFQAYEILGVADLDAALAAARAEPEEALAEASSLFAEFQGIAAGKQLGELSSNRHVRHHLEGILELAPNHLSARMILLHGSPDRPRTLSALTLSHELEPCLKILAWSLNTDRKNRNQADELLRLEEDCLNRLRAVEKETQLEYREILRRFEFSTKRLGKIARLQRELAAGNTFPNKTRLELAEQGEKLAEEIEELRSSVEALLK